MRYTILVILNLPIILLAFLNIVTQFKLKRMSPSRFRHQVILWLAILVVLVCSYPAYNYLSGNPILSSGKLSLLDIVQTTTIVYLIYILNNQRRKIEHNERITRDLHQEISIILSSKNGKS